MMREIDCIKINLSDDGTSIATHHIIVYNNIVHGQNGDYPSNGIRVWALSHHISVVGNLIYDIGANDAIAIHPDGAGVGAGTSHWVLDNIIIGNSGMEDGIDMAYATDLNAIADVKVVANRVQMLALSGLSTKTGRGQKCAGGGHEGNYFWYVGNIFTGSSHIGVNLYGPKTNSYTSGNIAYDNALNAQNPKNQWEMGWADTKMDHNTIIQTVSYRLPINIRNGANSAFTDNLLIRSVDGTYIGGSVGEQSNNAQVLSVSGINVPSNTAYNNDPRNWRNVDFVNNFTPDNTWSEINGNDTPGAFGPNNNWLGLNIKAFDNSPLENSGCGWEGPALVQQRLNELDINFCNSTLSTNELDQADLTIFPNPVINNEIVIRVPTTITVDNINIYNILGNKVLSKHNVSDKNKIILKPNLSEGIYIIKLNTSEKGLISKKIIIE